MRATLLRLLVVVAVAALLCLTVWLGGDRLGIPGPVINFTMAGIGLIALAVLALAQVQAQRGAASIEKSLRDQALAQFTAARPGSKAEIDELRKQFELALDQLRRSPRGKSALHSLPIYVLIGPPGSGKTTLLRESSLDFPFMTGRREIRGVGGTRNCDWWFGARGILLDTAGRYTVENEDRDEWLAFLGMIRKARPRRPINGVLIGVSIADVLGASDVELRSLADQIRERVDELVHHLEIVFPVYLLFTKCDQLAGFVEFFGRLGKEQRRQVWGFTVPFRAAPLATDAFPAEFDALYRRLAEVRASRFADDASRRDREKRYAFPLQFALAKQRIGDFLNLVQQSNPYQESASVRGVFFTSGTQEGNVVDKILEKLGQVAEVPIEIPREQRKCYFIDDVFEKVAFADADLAVPTAAREKRVRWLRRVGSAAAGVLAAFLVYDGITGYLAKSGVARDLNTVAAALVSPPPAPPTSDWIAQLHAALVAFKEQPAAEGRTALQKLFELRLRQTLVASAAKSIADEFQTIRQKIEDRVKDAPPQRTKAAEEAARAELDPEVVKLQQLLERYWFFHSGSEAGKEVGSSGPPRPVPPEDECRRQWVASVANISSTDQRPTELFHYFRDHRARLAVEGVPDLTNDDFVKVRSKVEAFLLNFLDWEDFKRRPVEQQFDAAMQLVVAAEADLREIAPAAAFATPFRLPSLYSDFGDRSVTSSLDTQMVTLRQMFISGRTGAEASEREEYLEAQRRAFAARIDQRKRAAWERGLADLKPRPFTMLLEAQKWSPESRRSPSEALLDRLVIAFVAPPPAGQQAPPKPTSPLRAFAKALEDAGKLSRGPADVAAVENALKGYVDATRQARGVRVETPSPDIPQTLVDAVARIEADVVDQFDAWVGTTARNAIDRTWNDAVAQARTKALAKYPFVLDAADTSVEEFVGFFGTGSLLDVLGRVAKLELDIPDAVGNFALSASAKDLYTRLTAMKKAFLNADGRFAAELIVRYSVLSGVGAFKIEALNGEVHQRIGTDQDIPLVWEAKDDLTASIDLVPAQQEARLTLRDAKPEGLKEPPKGLWSFLRIVRLGARDPVARTVTWTLGNSQVSERRLPLSFTDKPAVRFLLEEGAFAVDPPRSLFSSP